MPATRYTRKAAVVAPFALLLVSSAPHAAPIQGGQAPDRPPAAARPGGDRVLSEADRLRSALESPGFGPSVQAALEATRAAIPDVPTLPEPTAEDLAAVGSLPPGLRDPLAGLTAAVRASIDVVGLLPAVEVRSELSRLRRAMSDSFEQRGVPVAETNLGAGLDGNLTVIGPGSPVVSPSRIRSEAIAHAQRSLPEAALLISSALDRYLPVLAEWRGSVSPSRASVAGCDLVPLAPVLCVGSEADNVYTEDAALLVDLGGDNTYRNSAGGAPFLPPGAVEFVPVAVNLDLGDGSARYEPPPLTSFAIPDPTGGPGVGSERMLVAQGAGVLGGLGILVDVGGNDVYSATLAPDSFAPRQASLIVGQGAAVLGYGLAFDLEGDDVYRTAATPRREANLHIWAQGTGAAWQSPGDRGMGLLVDRGEGNDAYVIDAGVVEAPDVSQDVQVYSWVEGQGAGDRGLGILADDGGGDNFRASASPKAVGSEDFRLDTPQPFANSILVVQGAGYAAGEGFLLTGSGDSVYDARVPGEGRTMYATEVLAQGAGQLGTGVLSDEGGDDSYSARLSMEYERNVIVDDSCPASSCPPARALVSAAACGRSGPLTTCYPPGFVFAQGAGVQEGQGRLDDLDGRDSYVAEAITSLAVSLHDALDNPDTAPTLDVGGYWTPGLTAQGVAFAGSSGLLVDHAGTDSYSARVLNVVDASASSDYAPEVPLVTAVSYGSLSCCFAQGALGNGVLPVARYAKSSEAELRDGGGSGDTFMASWDNPVTTSPDTGGSLQFGGSVPGFQGSSAGTLSAAGTDTSVLSSPSLPVGCGALPVGCGQYRGFGTWEERTGEECAGNPGDPECIKLDRIQWSGMGEVPGATGTAPSVAFTPDTPQIAPVGSETVPVGARLLTPDGNPLPGAVIHFSLLGSFSPEYTFSQWWTSGVTGPDGVAQVDLPVRLEDPDFSYGRIDTAYPFKLYATFDGTADLYPVHAISDFAIA